MVCTWEPVTAAGPRVYWIVPSAAHARIGLADTGAGVDPGVQCADSNVSTGRSCRSRSATGPGAAGGCDEPTEGGAGAAVQAAMADAAMSTAAALITCIVPPSDAAPLVSRGWQMIQALRSAAGCVLRGRARAVR